MKKILQFLQIFLIVVMAFVLAEHFSHYLQTLITSQIQKSGIECQLTIKNIHTLTCKNIRYHQKPLAKSLSLTLRYAPLLQGIAYIENVTIKDLNINTLLSIQLSQNKEQKSSKLLVKPFIKKAYINAFYSYEGTHRLTLQAKNISLQKANISSLHIVSPYAKVKAFGIYSNQTLQLQGNIKDLTYQMIRAATIPFTIQADPKKIAFSLTPDKFFIYNYQFVKNKITGKYNYQSLFIQADTSTIYKKSQAVLHINAIYDKTLHYEANATINNKRYNIPINPLAYQKLYAHINGDLKKTDAKVFNQFLSIDIKRQKDSATFKTSLIQTHDLNSSLPKDMYLQLIGSANPNEQNLSIFSNYVEGEFSHAKKQIQGTLEFKKRYKDFNLPALGPVTIEANLATKSFFLQAKNIILEVLQKSATLKIDDALCSAQKRDQLFSFSCNINHLQNLTKTISQIYPIPQLSVDHAVNASGKYSIDTQNFTLHSKVQPQNRVSPLEYLEYKLHGNPKQIILDYYALLLKDHGFYATKPSIIELKNDGIYVQEFWIEDKVKISGFYNFSTTLGKFQIKAKDYRYSSIEGDIRTKIDIDAQIKQNKIETTGTLTLLGGVITYSPKKERIVKDEDIIVIDELQSPQESYFLKNVAINIKIDAKKPILYKIPDLYALTSPDLLLYKEFGKQLQLLGMIKIFKGVYHLPNQENIEISSSVIDFYGPVENPLLDLHLITRKDRYIIYITVAGELENPIVNFDSEPYLKPNEILSLLAFGTSSKSLISAALGGDKLSSMLSNLFIKDLVANFGIKLDTLTLLTSANRIGFEIGKRVSNKITIIYKNDEISTLIIRYQISKKVESDIIFGPQKSGAHLYYREMR
ncbi:translocation and assembly module TamB [Nitratiruptor sp. YY08-26]|uniref:translocation/assembly module TamB domain-containing protein n=1 Tax=unclassified Nitratiruptor TaxID=2624044 RepID=UPI0019166A5B|nr:MULTISPECIES: translocation/assembly module TamB domain-containing protein [unclassified Nitratiruptor]BCD61386.1 translocation and assembly module TamB [Nitratiruptor sp. YY08-13]BCD65320.1 translocation and assembly module TamB [Nitratiruptor sp. YY08-26]